jgi:DNA gyrase/topoisomerase IV subunit A
MNKKTITEFLNNEYREFALYTIENRAISSLIDGFKISQRKIIHISNEIWKNGSDKTLKVFQLAGKVASDSYYHHGGSSLENAIINLAQSFKNNAPLLEEDGQFGSLRSPDAGAPRYIGTKLSKNFKSIYKDFELLHYKEEEGNSVEPYYFLPIIPTILLNGTIGVAVGFSSLILNRDINDLIMACKNSLRGKKNGILTPHLNSFNGQWIMDSNNSKKWIIRGKYIIKNTTTIVISEIPPSLTYEKYENYLDELVDGKKIVSYDNNCRDDINYVIKFNRSVLGKMTDEQIIKLLKLEESATEIFNVLDENGKLKSFDSANDMVDYFVKFRLGFYHKRKQFLLDRLTRESMILKNKIEFIRLIITGKIKVNNIPKATIITNIEKYKLDKIDDSYDYLLRIPLYSLTKELVDKLNEDYKSKLSEIEELKSKDPKDMYLSDLDDLEKIYKKK